MTNTSKNTSQSMISLLVCVGLIILCGVLVQRSWKRDVEIIQLESQVAGLEADRAQLETQLKAAGDELAELKKAAAQAAMSRMSAFGSSDSASSAASVALDAGAASAAAPDAAAGERISDWRARQFISDIDEELALTSAQKEQVTSTFKQLLGSNKPSTDQARADVLRAALGDEIARTYEEKQKAALEKEKAERLEGESIVLSKKLNLSEPQAEALRQALQNIETTLAPQREQIRLTMREAMANHLGGDEAKATLTQQYDAIQSLSQQIKASKDKLLFDALGPNLSDEQKNQLLKLQAEQK